MMRPDSVNKIPGHPALEVVQDGQYRGHSVSLHALRTDESFRVTGFVDDKHPMVQPLRFSASGFASLQQARDAGVLALRALVDALYVDGETGIGRLQSGQVPTRRQVLDAKLNTLEWTLNNELIKQHSDPAEFWPAFAGMADVIEDAAGDHAKYVGDRIEAMLAEAGLQR